MPVAEHRTRTATRVERLEARVSRETKELCQKAATFQGWSLTDFVVNSAVEAATRTVQEHEFIVLTQRDRVAFIEALLNAPAPNARLQMAASGTRRCLRVNQFPPRTFVDIEPLGAKHGKLRAAFSCGVEPLDRYLKQQASQDAKKRAAVPYVLVSE